MQGQTVYVPAKIHSCNSVSANALTGITTRKNMVLDSKKTVLRVLPGRSPVEGCASIAQEIQTPLSEA
jgi:hypothetical protein